MARRPFFEVPRSHPRPIRAARDQRSHVAAQTATMFGGYSQASSRIRMSLQRSGFQRFEYA